MKVIEETEPVICFLQCYIFEGNQSLSVQCQGKLDSAFCCTRANAELKLTQ